MSWRAAPGSATEQGGRLFLAAMIVLFLPQLPLGNYVLYPFTILTTWFHEMGHGLSAILVGQDFERLVILPSGSGYAEMSSRGEPGALRSLVISAGGPLGPSIIGAVLIMASAREASLRPALYILAGAIALSVVIWVRSLIGWAVLPAVAVLFAAVAWRASTAWARFVLQFVGVIAAMSMLASWDYLFSYSAVIGGRPMLSDTGAMQQALFLPYWFWAITLVTLSAAMILASLKYALAVHDRPRRH